MGPRHSKVVGVEGVGDGGTMSMRSPPWRYRLKGPSSKTCFCPPLSHSVTLIKKPPAVGLGFPTFPPFLYSAVTIRLGATREFAGGKVRAWWFQPLGLPPSSPWPAETGREQGSPSGSQASLHSWASNTGRFWACREALLGLVGSRCTAGGQLVCGKQLMCP